jgi:hypothetical protein
VYREPLDARVADASGGVVHDAAEADLVLRVDDHLEVGKDILDLLPLEELLPADDPVGDAELAEGLLEGLRLRVGAVEDADFARALAFVAHEARDLARDPARLDLGRRREDDAHGVATRPLGEEHLLVARLRALRDDGVGDGEDGGARAVVLLELDDVSAGEVVLELEDVAHVGAAPAVDGLVVVADDAEVLVLLAEGADERELRAVRVLVLVDEDVAVARPPAREDVGARLPERDDTANEVVEVVGPEGPERRLVAGIDEAHDLGVVVALADGDVLGLLEGVLGVRDAREDRGRVEALAGLDRPEDLLDRRERVALIEDRERAPRRRALGREHPEAERMKRGHGDGARVEGALFLALRGRRRVLAQKRGDARAHLAGRLVREREREDRARRDAALEQPRDAVSDHPRLAGARAREHHERPGEVLHGSPLFGVQRVRHAAPSRIGRVPSGH